MSFLLKSSGNKKKGGRSRTGGGGGGLAQRRPGLPSSLLGGGVGGNNRNHQVRGRSNSLASHGSVGGYASGYTGGGGGHGGGRMLPPNAVDVGGGQFQIQRQTMMQQQQHRVIPQQQMQMQMQRPVQVQNQQHHHQMVAVQNQQQQMQVQHQQQAQQKEQAVEQQQDQIGDFSMESVMEDVRILEEQQRQADQKLDSAKRYKEQCTQHQQQVETTLSTLKYENGKNAELIQQQRITLQQCGRELGTLREEDTRADNDLRKFHDKLKKATACCRKIVSLYTQIDRATKKETDQRRVLADAEDKAREAETRYAETVRHEELVLKAIQAGKQTANVLAEESAKAESNCAKLDHELATHRKMETASAASLQEAEDEVKAEKKRGEEAEAALRAKIADAEPR